MGEFLGRVTSTCKCTVVERPGSWSRVVWGGEGDGLKAYAEASL